MLPNWAAHDWFLVCFAIGACWSVVSVILGGAHFGHGHGLHFHGHGHGHWFGHGHGHALAHGNASAHHGGHSSGAHSSWWACTLHPSAIAAFLAWFGGVGYLLTRHTGWHLIADLGVAVVAGLFGAVLLGLFLHFLQSHEQPMDTADYEMVGVLGKVCAPIRSDGVGELIFLRDGARTPAAARSEDGTPIGRGEEVIVTRYERGIAYVRTWAAMVPQSPAAGALDEALLREMKDVK